MAPCKIDSLLKVWLIALLSKCIYLDDHQIFTSYVVCRVSNLVVVDADDTNWHQRWQCQHWMTPIDTRMNWKIIYAGPAGLWKYNKIWSSGKCFWIHETSEMNFLQFLSNLAMKEENYFLGIPKIWVFSSHTTTKV